MLKYLLFVHLIVPGVWASDEESAIGSIHKIDMTDNTPKAPGHVIVMMDLKKLKSAAAHGHVVFQQFAKRVRVEFEGSGLPKGKYSLAVSENCAGAAELGAGPYKNNWTELHKFDSESDHIATEKSLPQATLRAGGTAPLVLEGKSVALFRMKSGKYSKIDCKTVTP